jgi:hypothetical protein
MIAIDDITRFFADHQVDEVIDTLGQYTGPEPHRVKRAILVLAQGDMFRLRHYLDVAMTDYRDVLYWQSSQEETPDTPRRD